MLRATRLLNQVREQIHYKHYSLRTEQSDVQWVRRFVKLHDLRHLRDIGQLGIGGFLAIMKDGFGATSWTAALGRLVADTNER